MENKIKQLTKGKAATYPARFRNIENVAEFRIIYLRLEYICNAIFVEEKLTALYHSIISILCLLKQYLLHNAICDILAY